MRKATSAVTAVVWIVGATATAWWAASPIAHDGLHAVAFALIWVALFGCLWRSQARG